MASMLATFWGRVTSLPASYLALWVALAVLTVGLVLFMRTRWGREHPTHRYVLASIVGHLLLICLATTVRFMAAPIGEPATAPVKVRIVMRSPPPAAAPEPEPAPVPPEPVEPLVEPEPESEPEPTPPTPEPSKPVEADSKPTPPEPIEPTEPPAVEVASVEAMPVEPLPTETQPDNPPPIEQAEPVTQPEPALASKPPPVETPVPIAPEPTPAPMVAEPTPEQPQPIPEVTPTEPVPQPIANAPNWQPGATTPVAVQAPPSPYGARTVDERWNLVERDGGSRATEDAVAAALDWLASAQSNDGRWDADRWSAGRERQVLGENRRSAGIRADTGVTGLATLALMGAGHSHLDGGPYAETLRAGLEFLLRSQAPDGGLAGDATLFAQTYCHSMATFALAEALADTRDARLHNAVERAVAYLLARQHGPTGGWRYRPSQPGDMSQMGWVIMALRSAELGGVEVPPAAWSGIERFVDTMRRGQQGGLACYRRDGPASRTMTAEALYCRQILGAPISRASGDEAVAALLGGPPGSGQANFYYWYYATLALHHHRQSNGYADNAWSTWNDALTRSLVSSQVHDGVNAGSWSPNTLWGGYGGRVYATAMAAMCLEVYYRYDPHQLVRDPWIAARPGGGTLR